MVTSFFTIHLDGTIRNKIKSKVGTRLCLIEPLEKVFTSIHTHTHNSPIVYWNKLFKRVGHPCDVPRKQLNALQFLLCAMINGSLEIVKFWEGYISEAYFKSVFLCHIIKPTSERIDANEGGEVMGFPSVKMMKSYLCD